MLAPAKSTASAISQSGTANQTFFPNRACVLSGEIFSSLAEIPGEYFYGGIYDGLKGALLGSMPRPSMMEKPQPHNPLGHYQKREPFPQRVLVEKQPRPHV
jgi:hypothetical protein